MHYTFNRHGPNRFTAEHYTRGRRRSSRIMIQSEQALTGAVTDRANRAGTGRIPQKRKRHRYPTEITETAGLNFRVQ